jgi:hypothetical protein
MKHVRFLVSLCGEAYPGSGIGCQYLFWAGGEYALRIQRMMQ